MAITFRKTGLSDLILERGRLFPLKNPITINQERYLTESNTPVVVDYGNPEKIIEVHVEFLTRDNYDGTINGLKTWFESSTINYSLNSFTLIDENGYEHTVQLWQDDLDFSENISGRYSVKMDLKEL